jgi:hypothetical protein
MKEVKNQKRRWFIIFAVTPDKPLVLADYKRTILQPYQIPVQLLLSACGQGCQQLNGIFYQSSQTRVSIHQSQHSDFE